MFSRTILVSTLNVGDKAKIVRFVDGGRNPHFAHVTVVRKTKSTVWLRSRSKRYIYQMDERVYPMKIYAEGSRW
jgi:hypothetical protein